MTSMPTERSKINNRATDDDVRRNVVNNVNDQRDLEMILMGREDGEWLGLIRSPRSRNGATFFYSVSRPGSETRHQRLGTSLWAYVT